MGEPLLFGAQLKAILSARGISASQLAKWMGFKSRTSLFRVLNDEVSYASLQNFWKELEQCEAFSLSKNEIQLMEKALDTSRQGLDVYTLNQAMHELLRPAAGPLKDFPVKCFGQAAPAAQSFRQLMALYSQSPQVHFVLLNCTHLPLVRLIGESLNPDTMHIFHLLNLNENLLETVHGIRACLPLLPNSCYSPYAIETPVQLSLFFVLWRNGSGQQETHYYMLPPHGDVCMMASCDKDFSSFWREALESPLKPLIFPIKDVLGPLTGPEDYVGYIQRYYELEKDRALYSLKPDVPINFIHPDLLVSAAMDGFRNTDIMNTANMETLIAQLYDIQLKRWQNFFEKRKVTHAIFSKDAMIRFARTGRQTDHFFAMRPYTPKEREGILSFLWEQSQTNPYFNIYFAKENSVIEDREISCYEGAGTIFQDANTSYAAGHQEVLLTHPGFAQQFQHYFMNELLHSHVLSPRETQHLWDYLISLCKTA